MKAKHYIKIFPFILIALLSFNSLAIANSEIKGLKAVSKAMEKSVNSQVPKNDETSSDEQDCDVFARKSFMGLNEVRDIASREPAGEVVASEAPSIQFSVLSETEEPTEIVGAM